MRLLVSFPFLNLYLHEREDSRVIEAEWRGFVSSPFLRQAITEALALAREHRATAWLADDRKLGPVRPADLEWVGTYALPALVDIGVSRFAVLEAEDPMNKLLINTTAESALPLLPMEFRRFTDVHQARSWAAGG